MKKFNVVSNTLITMSLVFGLSSCSKDNLEAQNEEASITQQSNKLEDNEIGNEGGGSGNTGGNNQMNAPIYQFYRNGDHLYTKNYDEGENAGYAYERILGLVGTSGSTNRAITRWYNLYNGDRVITTDVSQHPAIVNSINDFYFDDFGNYGPLLPGNIPGTSVNSNVASTGGQWQYEKILGYTDGISGNQPVYTYYNHSLKDHIYLTDFTILGNGGNGYVYEGISMDL